MKILCLRLHAFIAKTGIADYWWTINWLEPGIYNMDLKRYLLIEKKRLIFFQLTLSLIVLFALMSPAMADEDPEGTADPQTEHRFI